MFKFYFIIALCIAIQNANANDGRIFGGISVQDNSSPNYQAAILGPIYMCSGSIIRSDSVLTSAFCVYGMKPADIFVRLGSIQFWSGGQLSSVTAVATHPKYNSVNKDFNCGVIKLATAVDDATITQFNIAPIPLATSLPTAGSPGFLTGYGAQSSLNDLPNYMKKTRLDRMSPTACRTIYGAAYLEPEMFCAGWSDGTRDACTGDEGAPLMNNGEQIGIYSHNGLCGKGKASSPIMVNVPAVRSWILFAIQW